MTEILDGLVGAHPICRVAAYADLSAGMVLVARGEGLPPRERLDALCAEGALILGGVPGPDAPGGTPGGTPEVALLQAPDGLRVALRDPDVPEEALLCLCAPGAQAGGIEALLAAAARGLARIGGRDAP
ncbi:hypothetical protein [Hasllibacter halocynthiae]|uniref:hypothetical protein n=1 Tax=Hasllibacter halocynthiae TaxID=595589 RepID=UPI0011B20C62|nr:hypothetical protein [Hasllibacter halocynthiae]